MVKIIAVAFIIISVLSIVIGVYKKARLTVHMFFLSMLIINCVAFVTNDVYVLSYTSIVSGLFVISQFFEKRFRK